MRQQRRNLATSGALDPGGLPGLELRLSGSSLAGAADDPIATWADTSGHSRTAAGLVGHRPVISGVNVNNPNAPTGRLGANFNFGHPDAMDGTMSDVGVTGGNTFYLWLFASPFGVNGQVLYQDQGGAAPQLIISDAGGGKVGWRDADGTNLSTLGITADGLYHSLVYVFAPPSGGTGIGTIYHNGVSVYTHTWSYDTTAVTGYRVGANQVDNVPFGGELFELDYFSQAHSAEIVGRVLSWGAGYWGF